MKFVEDLKQWRSDRNLTEPQWDSIVGSLLEENQELREAYDNNDEQEIIDAWADHIVFCTNLLGQLGEDYIFPGLTEINYVVKSVDDIKELIELLEEMIETKQVLLVKIYTLKVINWYCKINIEQLGYDFECVMDETVREISSRQQDPKQKYRWEQSGSNGEKWQKSLLPEHKALWYKADYSKCKKNQG